jgi:hypothetical protein
VQSGYEPNNFNDYASSLVTLFELLVVNNWMITMDGFVKASGTKWARMYVISLSLSLMYPFYTTHHHIHIITRYFVSWWILAVVIVLNIVIAYIVASFPKKRRELLNRNRDEDELKHFFQLQRCKSTRFSTSTSNRLSTSRGVRSYLSTLAWLEAVSEGRIRTGTMESQRGGG